MESTSSTTVSSRLPPSSNADSKNPPRLHLSRYVSPSSGYTFPSLYSFPPFFTRQPNPLTWSHQRSQWIHLILSHSRHTRTSYFPPISSTTGLESFELFHNDKIKRTLSRETFIEILTFMASSTPPTIEFIPQTGSTKTFKTSSVEGGCYVYWKTPQEWAETIYDWIRETGQQGAILTFYELTESDPTLDLYQLPTGLLKKVLDLLQKQGKCSVLRGTLGEEGDGVKFV
ncbi:hypothetical protein JCM16303_004532 [Sporobolomyces ruberrimus]